jgi:hypothetical protein
MHDQIPTLPGALPATFTRPPVGPILGHPTKPRIRFFMADEGGAGGSDGGSGGSDGGDGGDDAPLSAADAKALRSQADRLMKERNTARDEAKAFKDAGLSPQEIAELKAARDKQNGGPTPEQIAEQARKDADKAANERIAARARVSAVREQAAALGFQNPADALALLDRKTLDEVAVDDQDEADAKAVKGLLEALGKERPYLLKKPGFSSARDAGIGASGSGQKPDPGPGTRRMAAAYASNAAAQH